MGCGCGREVMLVAGVSGRLVGSGGGLGSVGPDGQPWDTATCRAWRRGRARGIWVAAVRRVAPVLAVRRPPRRPVSCFMRLVFGAGDGG